MVPVIEDHRMSTIFGALHFWIETQIPSRLESPKTKNELIQLALKIESTAIFVLLEEKTRPGGENQTNKTSTSRA